MPATPDVVLQWPRYWVNRPAMSGYCSCNYTSPLSRSHLGGACSLAHVLRELPMFTCYSPLMLCSYGKKPMILQLFCRKPRRRCRSNRSRENLRAYSSNYVLPGMISSLMKRMQQVLRNITHSLHQTYENFLDSGGQR